ncbi:MAG: hypothetical protein GX654_15680 [Desulfatiglans sp.]|jgi:outer membrane lipoprotein-sorting protein|nr:hypothetical protein [Desulfatiglans sp.]
MIKSLVLMLLLLIGLLPSYDLSAQDCEKFGEEMAEALQKMQDMGMELEGKSMMSEAEAQAFG